LSQDGRFAFVFRHSTHESFVDIWDVKKGAPVARSFSLPAADSKLAITSDGRRLAVYSDNTARVFDGLTLAAISPPLTNEAEIVTAFFDPLGDILALQSETTVALRRVTDGQLLYEPLACSNQISHSEFSHDGQWALACCRDDQLTKCYARVWDVKTGNPVGPPLKHGDGVNFCCFSPDDALVATASEDYTAIVWDRATGAQLIPPVQHPGGILHSVAFDSTGKWFVTAGRDKTARIWSTQTGDPLTPAFRSISILKRAVFTPSNQALAAIDENRKCIIWPLTMNERPIGDLLDLARVVSGGKLNRFGRLEPESSDSLSEDWRRLRARYPAAFSTTPEEILHWHECALEESKASSNAFAVDFHSRYLKSQ
jgi:WD40 repeat protein